MQDLIDRLLVCEEKIQSLLVRLDLADKEAQLKALQKQSEDPSFWNQPASAQKIMKQIASLSEELESWKALQQRISDTLELARLEDEGLFAELAKEVTKIEQEVDKREFNTLLAGEYDLNDAYLAIHAGAGGTDSQDWAEMLLRMYLRWAEAHDYKTEILDTTPGEEAGIKSVTVAVDGRYAYGYLKTEKGVHRLIRLSPFDAAHRRHTSFALVEVLPQVEDDTDIEIDFNDLRIDTFRSAGAGGQNVQKNDTAVRITHYPTGIVVTCQNERSQLQNRENAMRVLRSRLLELKQLEHEQQMSELRGEYRKAEWGSQIRSYVLHPYQLVKDHRTDYEVGNAQSVLNGNLDGFIEAQLRSEVGE
ncbi:MAG: peptide chain release factor 2 [Chloroflexota bacterium]